MSTFPIGSYIKMDFDFLSLFLKKKKKKRHKKSLGIVRFGSSCLSHSIFCFVFFFLKSVVHETTNEKQRFTHNELNYIPKLYNY